MLRLCHTALAALPLALIALPACSGAGPADDSTGSLASPESLAALAAAPWPTELHFTVSTSLVQYPPPELRVTLVNDPAVRTLYLETLAQPPVAPATSPASCPVDYGIVYHLVFVTDGAQTTADLEASGCQTLTINGAVVLSVASNPTYWYDLSRVLQLEESAIYPYDPSAH